MPNGTVKFFNAGKGFGFITSDAGGKDIFVPSASLTTSGISTLKPGQRVSFEELPDSKGPKAVKLLMLPEAPRPTIPKDPPKSSQSKARSQVTYYHDHTSEWSCDVLTAIRELGYEPVVVEYLEAPPLKDQLRALSRLLESNGQSLVRKYDPLFMDLRLDDRFIGDNEFWEAIIEHPALIDGPLMATEIKASLCHSDDAVAKFFAAAPTGNAQPIGKPKGLSARALQILAGNAARPILKAEVTEAANAEVAKMPARVSNFAPVKASIDTTNKSRAKANPKAPVKKRSEAKATPKNPPKPKAKTVGGPRANSAGPGKGKKSSKKAGRKIAKRR